MATEHDKKKDKKEPPKRPRFKGKTSGSGRVRPRTDESCPVRALGMNKNDHRVYLTPSGRLMDLHPSKHQTLNLAAMFETQNGWLEGAFPTYVRGTDKVNGWSAVDLAFWLLVETSACGMIDLDRVLRGPGVWRGAAGGIIVHMGDKLWIGPDLVDTSKGRDHVFENAGQVINGFIYPAWPSEPTPVFMDPATAEDCTKLLGLIGCWNWKMPKECYDLAPILWLGWNCVAQLSGALKWRPHLRLIGDSGMGKTWLEEMGKSLMGGDYVVESVSDPTAAYVRQALGSSARPVLIDESEPDPKNDRSTEVLKTIRMASSDAQAAVGRGGADGQPTRKFMRCCCYLTAVLPSPTLPQDVTRLTQLDLGPLPVDADAEDVKKRVEDIKNNAHRYRARMILGWPRFKKNLEIFSRALSNQKQTHRMVDQLGTLLAGAATMMFDDVVDKEFVNDLVSRTMAFVDRNPVVLDQDECLAHLLSAMVDPYRHGDKMPVGEWIGRAMEDTEDGDDARKMLPRYGMKTHPANTHKWVWLLVANKHNGLESIYNSSTTPTRWKGGTWRTALGRIPGALDGQDAATCLDIAVTAKFARSSQRYVALPRIIFEDDINET